MAKKQSANSDDDVLLNINITGREQLTETRKDAKALNDEMAKGGKQDISKPTQSLKQQLREAIVEAQKLLTEGKKGTAEYRNAAKRVAEIKDNIQELNKTFEAFDPDNKFKVFANTAAAGAKIVQGYAGAMAFLGVNSEDAQKTIAKLQGIMAFTDAISSLADLKDSYRDLLLVLGLGEKQAAKSVAATAEVATAAEVSAQTQIAAQEAVLAAEQATAAATVAAEEAATAARLEGVASSETLTAAQEAAVVASRAVGEAIAAEVVAREALTAATIAGAEANAETIVATEGVAAAEVEATVAATGFGTALKLIGIGLIISAVAYLITNFDKLKAGVGKLFPALKDGTKIFNEIKEVAFGVGNVILQYLIAPIKVLIDVLKGDFKGALQDMKDGFNIVKNFNEGVAYEAKSIAEAAEKERQKRQIEINERKIAELRALGKNTTKLELETNKLKQGQLDKDDKDFKKNQADLESEYTVIYNTELKRRNDIYKAKLKTDLDAIKANNIAAKKIVEEGLGSQREVELKDVDIKYKIEIDLLNKRREANKKYNEDLITLTTAKKIEESRINKKYDDLATTYNKKADEAYFTEYEKRAAQIKIDAENALKAATTPGQKAKVLSTQAFLNNANMSESIASSASSAANTNLTRVESDNRPMDTDSPDQARTKVAALENARLDAENAAYELKKAQKAGQYEELAQLDADHEKNLTDIALENADARKQIADYEREARLKNLDLISQGLNAASDIAGNNTVAGKALAIASTTISTYLSAQQAFQSQFQPVADYTSPIRGALAAGIAVVAGLANVKKILSVKVPAKGGSGGGGAVGAAPTINTTVLNQSNNGSGGVQAAIQKANEDSKQKQLRAYIVNKDLNDQAAKDKYYQAQSSY